MAGAIVHNEFFKECIKQVGIANLDHANNLNIYAQGHDLLLYASSLSFFENRNISLIFKQSQGQRVCLYIFKNGCRK